MHILIDKERMCITHKHVLAAAIHNIAHIEMAHTDTYVCDEMDPSSFDQLTDLELNLLHVNMCGQKFEGFSRPALIMAVRGICYSLYESKINGFEVSVQANSILDSDKGHYRYTPGSNKATESNEPVKPLTSVPGVQLTLPPTPKQHSAPAHAQQAAAVRAPSTNNDAPKAGSKTGRVWEIADNVFGNMQAERGSVDLKMLRKDIITACESEGINPSTASVQFGAWKKAKGL